MHSFAEGFCLVACSLASHVRKERETLLNFLKQQKMTWPQYYDGNGWGNELSTKYGIQSIPATYLLNKDGKIIGSMLRGPALGEAVEVALTQ